MTCFSGSIENININTNININNDKMPEILTRRTQRSVTWQTSSEYRKLTVPSGRTFNYEGNSISKLQIVIEKNRMEIMTYKQHLFFNIISIQI